MVSLVRASVVALAAATPPYFPLWMNRKFPSTKLYDVNFT